MTSPETPRLRLDIQALRAVAVGLVVICHVWPRALPGGYIGVDVFFVISGFLITSHLLREVESTGSVRLLAFWARRIRRLLPAAFAVLLVCLAAAVVLLPATAWPQTLKEIVASAVYVENWSLATDAVDYMAAENDATMLQHFWSLSVEEQFYIAWPLLIVGVLALAGIGKRVLTHAARVRAVAALLVTITLTSLVASVVWTTWSPSSAYFSTVTRAWEFAAGGLLAFIPALAAMGLGSRLTSILHMGASWGGLALIAYAALTFDGDTAFPGVAALIPVLGAIAIIWAGESSSVWSPTFVGRFGPVQFVGDISYSVYLWHWPLVVMFLTLRNGTIGWRSGLIIIGGSLVLGALSKRWIEDPFRKASFWSRRTRRSFAFAGAGMALTAVLVAGATFGMNAQIAVAAEPRSPWSNGEELRSAVEETLSQERFPIADQAAGPEAQVDEWHIDDCVSVRTEGQREKCVYGALDSEKRLVVVGDSFGTSLLPALEGAFGDEYRIEPLTLGQCSVSDVETHSFGSTVVSQACLDHRVDTLARVASNAPDLVIIADATESTLSRVMGAGSLQEAVPPYISGLQAAYAAYSDIGVPTVIIESPPKSNCLPVTAYSSPQDCGPTAVTSLIRDVQARKAETARAAGIGFIDLGAWMCDSSEVCPDQIGHMLTRADGAHMTETFSTSLSEIVRDEVLAALRS